MPLPAHCYGELPSISYYCSCGNEGFFKHFLYDIFIFNMNSFFLHHPPKGPFVVLLSYDFLRQWTSSVDFTSFAIKFHQSPDQEYSLYFIVDLLGMNPNWFSVTCLILKSALCHSFPEFQNRVKWEFDRRDLLS